MYNIREVVIDEEMTGLDLEDGARMVEIGAVEVVDGIPTGRVFHSYINPEGRQMSGTAARLTGLTDEFLAEQPLFADIAQDLRDFIGDSTIVIYCGIQKDGSSADQNFLNREMEMAGHEGYAPEQWKNMRPWAKKLVAPGKGSLNDLLDKYGIDRSERDDDTGHGGIIDAELTAALYPKLKADFNKASAKKEKDQTLKRNSIKSPSLTMYSLPS